MKKILLATLFIILLTSCAGLADVLISPEEKACRSQDETAAAWNQLPMSKLEKAITAAYPELVKTLRKDGLNDSIIQRSLVAGLRSNLAACKQLMNKPTEHYEDLEKEDLPQTSKMIERIDAEFEKQDQLAFSKATGGKHFCKADLTTFTTNLYADPQKGCTYQHINGELTILQSGPTGILIHGPFDGSRYGDAKLIYIYSNNIDAEQADNSLLQNGLFSYEGLRRYQSFLGPKTVHAFRRIEINKH